MIDRLFVLLLAAGVVFAGMIVLELASPGFDPAALNASPLPAVNQPKPPLTAEPKVAELVATALAAPLFSPTRRPAEAAAAATADLPDVRLTGIVIEPDRRIAIFAAAGAKPFMRAVGDSLNDWRLDSISPGAVSLSGPTGTRILEPKPDKNLVRPSPPVAAARPPVPRAIAARPAAPAEAPGATRAPPPLPPIAPTGRPTVPFLPTSP